jgi:hypothetical protein
MKQTIAIVTVFLGLAFTGVAAIADDTFYLPIPGMAAVQSIQDQRQYQGQSQRLSPRNRLFMTSPSGQPQRYDATTINRYLMGSPNTQYRIRPVVRQPMYQVPGAQPER